ncbi:MAG: hypothetical protein JWM80_6643 [Cyanobacteria bacterium RYN_339]|nr:hypothetical protein [Cyanobacteria bacterium RYN_339]
MNKNIYGIMIASSLALSTLAGCPAPNASTGPSGSTAAGNTQTGANGGTGASATSDTGTAAAAAMAEERDMDDHTNVAQQEDTSPAFYVLAAGDKPATGAASPTAGADLKAIAAKVKAGGKLSDDEKRAAVKGAAKVKISVDVKAKVQARIKARNEKIAKRLDKLKNQRETMRGKLKAAQFVDNGDGTSTKTISFDDARTLNGKTASRKCTIKKTVQTDTKQLVSWHAEFTQTLFGGLTRTSTRDKVLQEDGSYLVTFHSELTLADGAKRVADWSKTIDADGAVTGTGTITWTGKDGQVQKTKSITLSGAEDEPKATADGSKATVTLPNDAESATVTKEDGGTATVSTDTAAEEATDPSDEKTRYGSSTFNSTALRAL